jgi:hypothetical protein
MLLQAVRVSVLVALQMVGEEGAAVALLRAGVLPEDVLVLFFAVSVALLSERSLAGLDEKKRFALFRNPW